MGDPLSLMTNHLFFSVFDYGAVVEVASGIKEVMTNVCYNYQTNKRA
jgi:hypothetical protein